MVSALDQVTAKLGEKILASSGDQQGPPPQQLGTVNFILQALRERGSPGIMSMATYPTVIKLVDLLRHKNPNCLKTVATYLANLNSICKLTTKNPDELFEELKGLDEDALQTVFQKLDSYWSQELNSTATRLGKWSVLKTFLKANGIRRAKYVEADIRNYHKYKDYALTREDCRKALDSCRFTRDKLLVSLLIESLQRIGTITMLRWDDVLPHLEKGEDTFLIWIDAERTKRNIEHWMPVGKLSIYYMLKFKQELENRNIDLASLPLILDTSTWGTGKPVSAHAAMNRVERILGKAGVRGRKQGSGYGIRYEKRTHSFRKFGVVSMQQHKVNEELIRYLMGQKRDTYSNWDNHYDELLEAYREAMPTLEDQDSLQEVISFARSRGFDLDPKAFIKAGRDIQVHGEPGEDGSRTVETGPGEVSF